MLIILRAVQAVSKQRTIIGGIELCIISRIQAIKINKYLVVIKIPTTKGMLLNRRLNRLPLNIFWPMLGN